MKDLAEKQRQNLEKNLKHKNDISLLFFYTMKVHSLCKKS